MNGQGQAVALRAVIGYGLDISPITTGVMDRDAALLIARQTVWRDDWFGPRQILFVHHDGYLELWEKELRE